MKKTRAFTAMRLYAAVNPAGIVLIPSIAFYARGARRLAGGTAAGRGMPEAGWAKLKALGWRIRPVFLVDQLEFLPLQRDEMARGQEARR